MKAKFTNSILVLLMAFFSSNAQTTTTITTTSNEVSENLNLKAVAHLFGESEDIEDFEKKLNSPYTQISNLDLDRNGYIDYMRVVETVIENNHLITIQAVIGDNLYRDIATIGVEKDYSGKTHVRLVGNRHFYGNNYIIEPVYIHQPVIVSGFWEPASQHHKATFYHNHYPVNYKPRVVCSNCHQYPINYNVRAYYNTNRTNHHPQNKPYNYGKNDHPRKGHPMVNNNATPHHKEKIKTSHNEHKSEANHQNSKGHKYQSENRTHSETYSNRNNNSVNKRQNSTRNNSATPNNSRYSHRDNKKTVASQQRTSRSRTNATKSTQTRQQELLGLR